MNNIINEKDSLMNLPESPETIPAQNSELFFQTIKDFIVKRTIEIVEETKLRYFYTKEEIENLIDLKIKNIDNQKNIKHVGNPIIDRKGTLFLHPDFFSNKIESITALENLLTEFPAMQRILETIGLNAIGTKVKTNSIRTSIATYFSSKYNTETDDVILAERKFKRTSTHNALQNNFITQLSILFGDEVLAATLKYGEKALQDNVDACTRKRGLGLKTLESIEELDITCRKLLTEISNNENTNALWKSKILPVYESLKNFNFNERRDLYKLIEILNYDLSIIKKIGDNENIENFSSEEKETIKGLIKKFDEEWEDSQSELSMFLPEFGSVISKQYSSSFDLERYNLKEIPFIHKIGTILRKSDSSVKEVTNDLDSCWDSLCNEIIEEYVPRLIKNREITFKREDIATLISLMQYSKPEQENIIPDSNKVNKLTKKIKSRK